MSQQMFCSSLIATSACVLAGFTSAAAPPPLRVGVTADSPPLVFKQNGQVRGLEAELATALGGALGRPVQFVERKWEALIPSLEAGKVDIVMSALSVTQARQTRVAFSEPYLRTGQMALVRREDADRYSLGLPDVLPGPVGVKKGTTGENLIQQYYPKTECRKCATYEDGVKALIKKKIALFFGDGPVLAHLARRDEANGLSVVPVMMSNEQYAWAMRKEDTDLRRQVNGFLRQIRDSGELMRTIKTWLPSAP